MSDDRLVNAAAEAALLGALLIDNRLINQVADRLRPDYFADRLHGRIFSAMLRFAATGKRADAVTMRPVFQLDKDCRYGDYLTELVENPAVTIAARPVAEQIIDFASRRATRDALHAAMEALSTDFDKSIAEITSVVDTVVWESEGLSSVDEALDLGDMVRLAEERDNRICDGPGSAGFTNALLPDLDKGLGPLEPGTYNIFAGRPGMGKTSLAASAAIGYALNGTPVLYLYAEMTKEQMGLRNAADLSFAMGTPIEHSRLKSGGLSQAERRTLAAVRERAALLPMHFIATGRCDIRRVWSIVARFKAMWAARGKKLGLVVVDNLSLYDATDSQGRPIDDDFKRVNAVSKTLDHMKTELDVAVLALAHIGRSVDQRANKRPMMSDLRDSGKLEQDADSVTLLYREEVYLKDDEPKRGEKDAKTGKDLYEAWELDMRAVEGKLELIFGKNRHGATSRRTVNFHGKFYAVRGGEVDAYSTEDLFAGEGG